jgi:hypothetical protein
LGRERVCPARLSFFFTILLTQANERRFMTKLLAPNLTTATLLSVLACAAQAQECSLEKSGNAFQGTSYVVKAKFPALDTKQALEAIRSKMELSGQKILGLDAASGVLSAEQPAKTGGRSLPLAATVRPIEGGTEAAVSIKLNPLQISQDEPVRKELCGYLAALTNMGPAGAPPLVAAAPLAAQAAATSTAAVAAAAKPNDAVHGPDTEFSKGGQPCLSGICIGDDITKVNGVAWSASSPTSKNKRDPSSQELSQVKAQFLAPEATQRKIATAMVSNHFDASAIAVSAQGGPPVFRVSRIRRVYMGLKSQQQIDALTESLKKGYAQIMSAHSFAYSKQSQYPSVSISSPAGTGAHWLVLAEAPQPTWDRQEVLRKDPQCGGAKPIAIN